MIVTEKDRTYLHCAVQQAQKAKQAGNLPIGAVIVLNDTVVAQGQNSIWMPQLSPTRHAEIEALEAIPPKMRPFTPQMSLYTTLEPCVMCTGAILLNRIGRVVFGALDSRGGASCTLNHLPPAFERLFKSINWIGPALPEFCDPLDRQVATLVQSRRNRVWETS